MKAAAMARNSLPATALLIAALASVGAFGGSAACRAETLALSKKFVDQVKDQATIDAKLHVDVHPDKPHTISSSGNDGDIHMAGRANEIRLPLVAEIINAKLEPQALDLLRKTATGSIVPVSGIWRIWFEHLGKEKQVQGATVQIPASSNPAHLFEIHPLTRFGNVDVERSSFVEIKKYQAYDASTAFGFYEANDSTLQASSTAIMIAASQGKYNYAEFAIERAGPVVKTSSGDGFMMLANVYDTNDDETPVTAAPRRMVFVKGSEPADRVQKLAMGDRLHVLGIPRVNLAEVASLVAHHGTDEVEVNLPYEMIIVAVLPE
jgi:hypothetical protein